MASQQVLSVLEISEDKATLITGEFLNSRLNILKLDEVFISGMANGVVEDQAALSESLKQLFDKAASGLGLIIKQVILLIPDFLVKKVSKKVTVQITNSDKRISAKDINFAIKEAINSSSEAKHELINVVANRYLVNEVPFYQVPLHELADILTIEMDLFYANRKMAHQYVAACERSGIGVIDICLNAYAAGKEMALLQQPEDTYIIAINLRERYSSLALFNNNRLISVRDLPSGFGLWLDDVVAQAEVAVSTARMMCREFVGLNDYDNNSTVWYENQEGRIISITKGGLNKMVAKGLNKWLNEIISLCQPIADKEQVVYYLYGDACDIEGITDYLNKKLKAPVKLYVPQTIGARRSAFTAALGAFYVYHDLSYLQEKPNSSIDVEVFNRLVASSYVKPEKSFTDKLKNFFFESRSGG